VFGIENIVPLYQQVKVLVSAEVAIAFKQACLAANTSMAKVLSGLMSEYSKRPVAKRVIAKPNYSTRRHRQAAIKRMVNELHRIKEA